MGKLMRVEMRCESSAQAHDISRRVHRLLEDLECKRRRLRDAVGKRQNRLVEIGSRHDAIDHAETPSFLGRDALAGE